MNRITAAITAFKDPALIRKPSAVTLPVIRIDSNDPRDKALLRELVKDGLPIGITMGGFNGRNVEESMRYTVTYQNPHGRTVTTQIMAKDPEDVKQVLTEYYRQPVTVLNIEPKED